MSITINPALQSNAQGTFGVQWDGLIQGNAYPDPAARYSLAGGWIATTETLPMWGGIGISEAIPTPPGSPPLTPDVSLGGPITRALNVTGGSTVGNLTGITVFDQAYGMINSPQSPVPLAPNPYGQVMFYRLGSGARIAVAIDPILVELYGDVITEQVSWDFVNQRLVQYAPAFAAATVSNAVWASTGGGQMTLTVNVDYTSAGAGTALVVSGIVNTGGTSTSALNGTFNIKSVTDSTHVVVTFLAASSPGTYASGGTIAAGGGALPCKILRVVPNNCMIVNYDPVAGFATWNRNGAAAIIRI